MKKVYAEPTTEVIRYNDVDVILTSVIPGHHCGEGSASHHEYGDEDEDGHCDTNTFECQNQFGGDTVEECEHTDDGTT